MKPLDALRAAAGYVRANPTALVKVATDATKLRFGIPIRAIRWAATQGKPKKNAPKDLELTASPPAIHFAASVDAMGTPLRVSASIRIDDVYIGPSDYVPWLTDRKWAHIRVEGQAFGDVPLNVELKLEVWDSPNSAGIIIDAIRAAKIALDRGIGGPLLSASSYFMKSPPEQYGDDVCRDKVEAFITGESEI